MKKKLLVSLAFLFAGITAFSQGNSEYIKQPTLALHFLLNDFTTATNIRTTSISAVIRDKTRAKIKDMSPGLAVSYLEGISDHVDFSTSLGASFVDYPFEKNGKIQSSGSEALLLELDASLHVKMFPDKYWVNPYVSAGIATSKFKGYYGALLPLGVGLQVDLFHEAFLFLDAQYRVPVTTTTSYHFLYSFGFAGNIGTKKKK